MGLLPSVIVLLLMIGCIALMFGGWRNRRFFRTIGGIVCILVAAVAFGPSLMSSLGNVVGTVLTWLIPLLAVAAVIAAIYFIVRIIQNR